MANAIEVSENAHKLWMLITEKGGKFENSDLKTIFGKTVSSALKKELIDNGLLELVTLKPRQVYQPLVPGADVKAKIKQKPPKKAAAGKKPSTTQLATSFNDIMEQVGKFCQPYFDRIDELTDAFERLQTAVNVISKRLNLPPSAQQSADIPSKGINPTAISQNAFFNSLKRVCEVLDEKSRFGGLIPLPEVWPLMAESQLNLTWPIFEKMLYTLEEERKIDLQIANDPSHVRFPERGIPNKNRGLIYYVSIRGKN